MKTMISYSVCSGHVARSLHRPPVIGDVARTAGVSVPTVSRVLTGSTPVSEKTRRRVEDAIQELGYRPNGAARALVAGQQPIVGILTSDTTRYGYASSIQGIEEAARQASLLVAITVLDDGATPTSAAIDVMLGQPLVGVIVLEFDERARRALRSLPRSVPVISVRSATEPTDVAAVLFDDYAGGFAATQYLLGLGHHTVYHVGVPSGGGPSGRSEGWRDALHAAGAVVHEPIPTDWTPASGYRAGAQLALIPGVTAVFCGNDEVAFGVMKALADAGRSIPDEISVVGFDDHPLASFWSPALTTMGQDFVALGAAALNRLVLGDESTSSVPIPGPRLIVRSSSASRRPDSPRPT